MCQTDKPIALALKGFPGEVTIATKTHAQNNRKEAERHIDLARQQLDRDCLDTVPFSRVEWFNHDRDDSLLGFPDTTGKN